MSQKLLELQIQKQRLYAHETHQIMTSKKLRSYFWQIIPFTLIVLIFALWFSRTDGTYSSDTGLRLFQAEQLAQNNFQTIAVPYAGEMFDPDWEYIPYYYAYSKVKGEILLNISPFLPYGTAILSNWFGDSARSILPAFGGILTAVAIYLLAKESELRHPLLMMWGTLFATPVLFYSFTFWDHTLGTAFATWGVYFGILGLTRQNLKFGLIAGIILGLGLGQRPEMYAFALAFGAAFILVAWRRWQLIGVVALGGILGVLLIWFLQYRWVGHPFGMAFAPHFFWLRRRNSIGIYIY